MAIFKTNLHTHTQFSDGSATVEGQVLAALDNGFISIGISDHSYNVLDGRACLQIGDERRYIDTVKSVRDQYRDKIDVFCGLELDSMTPGEEFRYRDEYDYIIGSVHYFKYKGNYYPISFEKELNGFFNDLFHGDITEFSKYYYDDMMEHITRSRPDIVGHFDLINKCFTVDDECDAYRTVALEALREVMRYTKRFEVNTGCMLWRQPRIPYPSAFILEEIRKNGGTVVVSSDCHDSPFLAYAFDEMTALLKKAGFSSYDRLTKEGFVQEAL